VPFNFDFAFTFHTLLIKFSPKVGYTRQKKITLAGDLKGDFYEIINDESTPES
jgi:hypothetical protein